MVLLDTNCRNTVLSNNFLYCHPVYSTHPIQKRYIPLQPSTCTVPCVSVLGWIRYEYSTDLYRYSTQFLLFACIHSLIPTPIHFKMSLMYYMYHKFSRGVSEKKENEKQIRYILLFKCLFMTLYMTLYIYYILPLMKICMYFSLVNAHSGTLLEPWAATVPE